MSLQHGRVLHGGLVALLLLVSVCGRGKEAGRVGEDASTDFVDQHDNPSDADKGKEDLLVGNPVLIDARDSAVETPETAGDVGAAGRGGTDGSGGATGTEGGQGAGGAGGSCPTCVGGEALWVRTALGRVQFMAVAADGLGNAYAAGLVEGTGTVTLGSETITGASTGYNALLIKYDPQGQVIWARITSGPADGSSLFKTVAVDPSGNIVVAGSIFLGKTYTFGDQDVTSASGGWNFLAVKYDPSGRTLWARSNSTGGTGAAYSGFNAAAVDRDGNIYLAGYIYGLGTYTFGIQSIAGQSSSHSIPVLLKYDAAGTALWVRGTVATPAATMVFTGVALDPSGNIYAVGPTDAVSTYVFGDQNVAGGGGVLVKYDPSGAAQWARTASVSSAKGMSVNPQSVTVDASGDVTLAAHLTATATYGGDTLTLPSGVFSSTVLARYSSAGDVRWTRMVGGETRTSYVYGMASDAAGNVYVAGSASSGTSLWGTVSLTIPANLVSSMVVAKYDRSGEVQWARTIPNAPNPSKFVAAASGAGGGLYAVGLLYGTGSYAFAPDVTVSAPSSTVSVLVKYQE